MADSLSSGVGATWQPHGWAAFRTNGQGTRVVVLPTRCPSGKHVLTQVGYRATEHERVLHVSCEACTEIPRPDHAWALKTGGSRADAAEFDDAPYAELLARLQC